MDGRDYKRVLLELIPISHSGLLLCPIHLPVSSSLERCELTSLFGNSACSRLTITDQMNLVCLMQPHIGVNTVGLLFQAACEGCLGRVRQRVQQSWKFLTVTAIFFSFAYFFFLA